MSLRQRRNERWAANQAYGEGYRLRRSGPLGTLVQDPMPDIGWRRWNRAPTHFETMREFGRIGKYGVAAEAAVEGAKLVGKAATWFFDKNGYYPRGSLKRKRVDSPELQASGTYSGVPWRPGGAARWDRGPKRWDAPDQPWPTVADGAASASGGVLRKGKSHFNSKVRYTRD